MLCCCVHLYHYISGKNLICCATYVAVLKKRSIKVVEKLGNKKNTVYAAVLWEPQHIPYFFFYKIPPSFIQQIQNPWKCIICFQNPPYFDIICSFLFIFFNLLQPMKICCSSSFLLQPSSKPTNIVVVVLLLQNPRNCFRASFF